MEIKELRQNLSAIQQTATTHHYTLFRTEQALAACLQDYLWEDQGLHKKVNIKKFRQLASHWHPDKLQQNIEKYRQKKTQDPARTDLEWEFLSWVIKTFSDKEFPFKTLNNVKEVYRPELRFRKHDLKQEDAGHKNFYFFSEFATFFSWIYFLAWPLFYLLEALERNIDRYQDEKHRNLAKKIYHYLSLTPFIILCMMIMCGDILLESLVTWGANFSFAPMIINILYGLLLTLFAGGFGINFYEKVLGQQLKDHPADFLQYTFIQVPFSPVKHFWHQFRQTNNVTSAWQKTTIFAKMIGASLVAALLIAMNLLGIYLASPLYCVLPLFPLVGLLAVNMPLLLSDLYTDPKKSLSTIGEYFFAIYSRYQFLATHAFGLVASLIVNSITYLRSYLPTFKSTTPNVIPSEIPASSSYWQGKIQKWTEKTSDELSFKKRTLKKARNELLKQWNITDGDSFYERLEEVLNQRSILMDEHGHVVNTNDNQYLTLEILNLRTQLLFLQEAQKQNISSSRLISRYPQDLDYHHLASKDELNVKITL